MVSTFMALPPTTGEGIQSATKANIWRRLIDRVRLNVPPTEIWRNIGSSVSQVLSAFLSVDVFWSLFLCCIAVSTAEHVLQGFLHTQSTAEDRDGWRYSICS